MVAGFAREADDVGSNITLPISSLVGILEDAVDVSLMNESGGEGDSDGSDSTATLMMGGVTPFRGDPEALDLPEVAAGAPAAVGIHYAPLPDMDDCSVRQHMVEDLVDSPLADDGHSTFQIGSYAMARDRFDTTFVLIGVVMGRDEHKTILHVPCDDGDHIVLHRPDESLEDASGVEEMLAPWPERFRLMRARQDELARKVKAMDKAAIRHGAKHPSEDIKTVLDVLGSTHGGSASFSCRKRKF